MHFGKYEWGNGLHNFSRKYQIPTSEMEKIGNIDCSSVFAQKYGETKIKGHLLTTTTIISKRVTQNVHRW